MRSLKCENCNGDMTISENKAFAKCDYCGGQVQLEQSSPVAHSTMAHPSGTYKLVLVASGIYKIQVIKIVREITGVGLAAAKDAVDKAPTLIIPSASLAQLEPMKLLLEAAGAVVAMVNTSEYVHVNHTLTPVAIPTAAPVAAVAQATAAAQASASAAKKDGCYIATAVYGSYDCPQVWTLRRFRDKQLAATWYGRLFIRVYYFASPTAVRWFGEAAWFRGAAVSLLDRLVLRLKSAGILDTRYEDANPRC